MQEPPLVTIRNPASDAPLSDVIGSGNERLVTRRQKRWAWGAAGVAVLVAGVSWGVQQLQEQRRLDRGAVREVSVDLIGNDLTAPEKKGVAQLTLTSSGRHPLTVLSARLDLPSFPELRTTPTSLRRGEPTVVDFQVPSVCPAAVKGRPTRIELRVRTYRGDTTTVRVDPRVGTGFSTVFVYQALGACGRTGASALDPVVRFQGGEGVLAVVVQLHNASGVPRAVRSAQVGGGLVNFSGDDILAGPAAPLTLAPDQHSQLRVTLGVEDCDTALAAWAGHGPGGITVPVIGSREDLQLVPFGDPTVVRFVRSVCAQQGKPTPVQFSGVGVDTVTVTPSSPSGTVTVVPR